MFCVSVVDAQAQGGSLLSSRWTLGSDDSGEGVKGPERRLGIEKGGSCIVSSPLTPASDTFFDVTFS
jgi:hypothetical protein